MKLEVGDRRTFVALACLVAWTDGVVTAEEREHVLRIAQRMGADAVSSEELERWLAHGLPESEVAALPPSLGEYFVYEAMQLIEADGEIDDRELRVVEQIMARVFTKPPAGTPLARIALVRRRQAD